MNPNPFYTSGLLEGMMSSNVFIPAVSSWLCLAGLLPLFDLPAPLALLFGPRPRRLQLAVLRGQFHVYNYPYCCSPRYYQRLFRRSGREGANGTRPYDLGRFGTWSLLRSLPVEPSTLIDRIKAKDVSPRPSNYPLRRSLEASISTSSLRTSLSTTSSSSTTSLRSLISSLTTGRFSTTTSSSTTGTSTSSSSPISASGASWFTGTRSTETSSRLFGTRICSRSVFTRLRTRTAPTSRSRVPALSSSSALGTLSSSSPLCCSLWRSRSTPPLVTPGCTSTCSSPSVTSE